MSRKIGDTGSQEEQEQATKGPGGVELSPNLRPPCDHDNLETLGGKERVKWWTRDPPNDRKGRSVRHHGTRRRCPRCSKWIVYEEGDAATG